MFADITNGHFLLADWLFLIGGVFAFVAAVASVPVVNAPKVAAWSMALVCAAICLAAVGWLVL